MEDERCEDDQDNEFRRQTECAQPCLGIMIKMDRDEAEDGWISEEEEEKRREE